MKFCTECKRWLPYKDFKSNKGWMHPLCRRCNKDAVLAAKAKRKEKKSKVNKYGVDWN